MVRSRDIRSQKCEKIIDRRTDDRQQGIRKGSSELKKAKVIDKIELE